MTLRIYLSLISLIHMPIANLQISQARIAPASLGHNVADGHKDAYYF